MKQTELKGIITPILTPMNADAVSYTHLDVYKRQAYNNPITVSPISYYSIIHFNYIIYTILRPFLSKYAHIKFRYKTNPKIMSNALKKCQ